MPKDGKMKTACMTTTAIEHAENVTNKPSHSPINKLSKIFRLLLRVISIPTNATAAHKPIGNIRNTSNIKNIIATNQ
jgi:hypothetical protein